jgi:uncharacterized protein
MKWSKYNIEKEFNGKKYLYNSISNALIEVDDDLSRIILLFKDGQCDLEELEMVKQLSELKIIVKSDEEEVNLFHMMALNQRFDPEVMYLTIAPTQECNLNCIYCYEKWRDPIYFTNEVEDMIIRLITDKSPKKLRIVWFGGEPLLALSSIISLSKKINNLNISYDQSIITNGLNLDVDTFCELIKLGISKFQITIDGDKTHHDHRRPKKDGDGSYDQIHFNIHAIIDYCKENKIVDIKINIRINIDKTNFDQYAKVFKHFEDIDAMNIVTISPGITKDYTNCSHLNCFNPNEFIDFAIDLFNNFGLKVVDFYPNNILKECFARHNNSFLIGPNGDLYKCWHDLGNKEKCIGHVSKPELLDQVILTRFCLGTDPFLDKTCKECKFLMICGGGCPNDRYVNQYYNGNIDTCTMFKHRFEELMSTHLMSRNIE